MSGYERDFTKTATTPIQSLILFTLFIPFIHVNSLLPRFPNDHL